MVLVFSRMKHSADRLARQWSKRARTDALAVESLAEPAAEGAEGVQVRRSASAGGDGIAARLDDGTAISHW